jgi:hypothetical protein
MADKQDVSKWVVGLLVAVLIATALLPTIFSNLNTMENDTTNFSTVEIAIISVCGILILVGFLYKIMKKSGV